MKLYTEEQVKKAIKLAQECEHECGGVYFDYIDENNYENHFHEVDRKWIVNAMCQCALIFNSEVR